MKYWRTSDASSSPVSESKHSRDWARQEVHEGVYGGKGRQMLFSQFVREIYLPWSEHNSRASSHYKHKLLAKMLCRYFEGRTLGQITALAVERFKRERAGLKTKFGDTRSPHTSTQS